MHFRRFARSLAVCSLLAAPAFASEQDTPPAPAEARADRPVLDVVFALDTTGSMGALLEGAKQKIWSIASRMASGKPTPRVRVGLVAYRDQGDAYVTRVFPLTEDLDAVYKELSGYRADGGGDGPEAVQDALADAVSKMQWTQAPHAAKMIFLVGDAPAHEQDKAKLFAASKAAIAKGIVVNTVRCGADAETQTQFTMVAKPADGHFDSIAQTGGVVATATPYDGDLSKLNAELMDTALYAGKAEAQAAGELRRKEAKALPATAAADRLSYAAKAAPKAPAAAASGASAVGAFDLADAPEKAAELKPAELPAPMRSMNAPERVAYAKQQQAHRQEVQEKITALSKKRDEYLATEASKSKDAFDGRVFESVKASAEKAGVAYK